LDDVITKLQNYVELLEKTAFAGTMAAGTERLADETVSGDDGAISAVGYQNDL
jgi:hypothetical protein